MNERRVAKKLLLIAKELLDSEEDYQPGRDDWLTPEDVDYYCGACADRMRERGIKKIRASIIEDTLRQARKWKKLPKGWKAGSLKKYWDTLTGDVKHKTSKCIKLMKDKVTDAGKFCGALRDRIEGTTKWRK